MMCFIYKILPWIMQKTGSEMEIRISNPNNEVDLTDLDEPMPDMMEMTKNRFGGWFIPVDAEGMLAHAGDFGNYQFLLLCLFCGVNVLSALHYFGQTFTSITSDMTEVMNSTDTNCGFKNNNMYGYVSIVQELKWCGEHDWMSALGQSMFFVGSVIGSLVLGVLADRIGRLHVLVIANLLAFVGNALTAFSQEIYMFSFTRFISGCATDSNFVMMYIIVMEYIRPSMRTKGLNWCIGIFYCIGCVVMPWVAVASRTWRIFLAIVAIPHLLIFTFYLMIPESAEWLISKGRTEEAIACFRRIAYINKNMLKRWHIQGLRLYSMRLMEQNKNTSSSLIGLFKTPRLRRKTLILTFKSMVMTLCYDAISKNVNGLGYSPFVLFSVTSLTILPACVFITYYQDVIGRKALASGALFISGLVTITTGYILTCQSCPRHTLTIVLMIVSRLTINVAYNSGAQYAVELIPTEVRAQGVSFIHVAGYAASFFSSYILYLHKFWGGLPEVILGILLLLGSAACLALPETLNRTLPITLDDGENFGEDEHLCDFVCCKARKVTKVDSSTSLTRP